MQAINIIITDAGRAAIVAANNAGTLPIVITQAALGSASWTPTAAATALQTEIKRLTTTGGGAVADDTLHVTAIDASTDIYSVKEVGLYTDGGVLFAIYSQASIIADKGTADLLLAFDMVFTTIAPGSVTVGNANFNNPPATTTVAGVVELATNAEATTGTDSTRAVTPAGLKAVADTKSNTGHIHDDRYYTEAEIDARLSNDHYTKTEATALLDLKASASHYHGDISIKDTATMAAEGTITITPGSTWTPTANGLYNVVIVPQGTDVVEYEIRIAGVFRSAFNTRSCSFVCKAGEQRFRHTQGTLNATIYFQRW